MEDANHLLAEAFEAFEIENWAMAERLYRKVANETVNQDEKKTALHMLAFTLSMEEDFSEAISLYEKLLVQAQNDFDKAIAMHQIGMVYRMERRFSDAFEMFSKEKKFRETSLNHDLVGFSANAYEFGQIMLEKEHFEQAFTYFTQALAYGETANDLICIACAQRGLGAYYARISDNENAKRYFKESISTFNEAGDIQGEKKVRDLLIELCS